MKISFFRTSKKVKEALPSVSEGGVLFTVPDSESTSSPYGDLYGYDGIKYSSNVKDARVTDDGSVIDISLAVKDEDGVMSMIDTSFVKVKALDTSIDMSTDSTNPPTSAAVVDYVENYALVWNELEEVEDDIYDCMIVKNLESKAGVLTITNVNGSNMKVQWGLYNEFNWDAITCYGRGRSYNIDLPANGKLYLMVDGSEQQVIMINATVKYSVGGRASAIHDNKTNVALSAMFMNSSTLCKVSENFLSDITLTDNCFAYMFMNCTSLTNAPKLPATALASNCYLSMFQGCSSLANAPDLPATTLSQYCYEGMFSGCTSLVEAPDLLATSLPIGAYMQMFYGCTSLSQVKAAATSWDANATNEWLYGVASIGNFYHAKGAS